jgi:hypothetical protein
VSSATVAIRGTTHLASVAVEDRLLHHGFERGRTRRHRAKNAVSTQAIEPSSMYSSPGSSYTRRLNNVDPEQAAQSGHEHDR